MEPAARIREAGMGKAEEGRPMPMSLPAPCPEQAWWDTTSCAWA